MHTFHFTDGDSAYFRSEIDLTIPKFAAELSVYVPDLTAVTSLASQPHVSAHYGKHLQI